MFQHQWLTNIIFHRLFWRFLWTEHHIIIHLLPLSLFQASQESDDGTNGAVTCLRFLLSTSSGFDMVQSHSSTDWTVPALSHWAEGSFSPPPLHKWFPDPDPWEKWPSQHRWIRQKRLLFLELATSHEGTPLPSFFMPFWANGVYVPPQTKWCCH